MNPLERWQTSGAHINILNPHEANWGEVPQLRARGIPAPPAPDWAIFWGDLFPPTEFEGKQWPAFHADPKGNLDNLSEQKRGERINIAVLDGNNTPN